MDLWQNSTRRARGTTRWCTPATSARRTTTRERGRGDHGRAGLCNRLHVLDEFPTTANSYQTSLWYFVDTFISVVSPAGSNLLYSTYSAVTTPTPATASRCVARTSMWPARPVPDFPTTADAFQPAMGAGYQNAFLAVLNPRCPGPARWSTRLFWRQQWRCRLRGRGRWQRSRLPHRAARSTNFPTTRAPSSAYWGAGLPTRS